MNPRERLHRRAQEWDMDYFGVAPAARLAHLPEGRRPADLVPGAKSVVVLGKKIPQGPLTAHRQAFEGKRIQILSFTIYCINKINTMLNVAAVMVSRTIEGEYGCMALPVPAGEPHDEEQWMGVMSNRYAAYCAGLGEMTWSGFVATPEAGPRILWVSIVTDMELEPDELYRGPRLCRHEQCRICVSVCPVQALSPTETELIKVDGVVTGYGKRDKPLCRCAVKGLVKGTPGRLQNDIPMKRQMGSMEDWYRLTKKDDPWQRMEFNHGNYCLRCMTECPVGRDE